MIIIFWEMTPCGSYNLKSYIRIDLSEVYFQYPHGWIKEIHVKHNSQFGLPELQPATSRKLNSALISTKKVLVLILMIRKKKMEESGIEKRINSGIFAQEHTC
jgi:hypothetical protein